MWRWKLRHTNFDSCLYIIHTRSNSFGNEEKQLKKTFSLKIPFIVVSLSLFCWKVGGISVYITAGCVNKNVSHRPKSLRFTWTLYKVLVFFFFNSCNQSSAVGQKLKYNQFCVVCKWHQYTRVCWRSLFTWIYGETYRISEIEN